MKLEKTRISSRFDIEIDTDSEDEMLRLTDYQMGAITSFSSDEVGMLINHLRTAENAPFARYSTGEHQMEVSDE